MSLYTPRAFASQDLAQLDALAMKYPFASLVTVDRGEPSISHVPVLYRRDGDRVELSGHLARPNPQSRHAGNALVVLHGPHAYVSPSWYPDKAEHARVPTWNYVIAHLAGSIELFDDEPALAEHVAELSKRHEAQAGGDWMFDAGNPAERVQLRGIVGFRMRVERIELKLKLNQNHPQANRRAVAERLDAGDSLSRDVASLMRTTLED